MVENGHIYAPPGWYEVAQVLGEPEDAGTLCTSSKINPHSLIRPSYASHQGFGPEHFPDGFDNTQVPDSGSADWYYTKGRWGYAVPTVGMPQSINVIKDKPWFHFDPVGDSWLCMTHFDGYRHNVKPQLSVGAAIEAGMPITVMLITGSAQQNILSETGKGNNGGVVGVPEVLGEVRVGCTVYTDGGSPRVFISANPIALDGSGGAYTIETGLTAQAGRRYTIVPWATDGNIVNGQVQSGSRFFSLMLSEDFEGVVDKVAPSAGTVAMAIDKGIEGTWPAFKITVKNTLNKRTTVNNFRLYANYQYGGQHYRGEVSSSMVWFDPAYVDVESNGTAEVEAECRLFELVNATFAQIWVEASCSDMPNNHVESTSYVVGDLGGTEIIS